MLHEIHFPRQTTAIRSRAGSTFRLRARGHRPASSTASASIPRRYFHMIVALMDAGFIVAADDHVGHGATAIANGTWGDWGDAGPHTMMEDEKRFMDIVSEKYPSLPYFMFGHSMGSMITRDFCTKYGDELAGAIYCGTTGIFEKTHEVRAKLDDIIAAGGAHDSDPSLVGELMGWMFARCEEGAELGNEWICHDPWVQKDHAEDPFDAFTHPVHNISLRDFIDMMLCIEGKEWAERVPVDLPGALHRGRSGSGGQLRRRRVQMRQLARRDRPRRDHAALPGYRHEIHNYDDIKEDVEDTVIEWMMLQL